MAYEGAGARVTTSLVGFPDAPPCYWEQTLSPPQARVVELASIGLTYQQIAERSGVTSATVKHHLRLAYQALEVRGQIGAVRWWWEHVEKREYDDNHVAAEAAERAV